MIIRGKKITYDDFAKKTKDSKALSLEVSGTFLKSEIFDLIIKMNKLTSLYLNDNENLSDYEMENIFQMQSLKSVHIKGCSGIKSSFLNRIYDNESLRELYLEDCVVDDGDLININKFKKLWSLILSNTNVTDRGIRLIGITGINLVGIENCKVSGCGFDSWRTSEKFSLYADSSDFDDLGLSVINESFCRLWNIKLNNTLITDAGMLYLKNQKPEGMMSVKGTTISKNCVNWYKENVCETIYSDY